MREIFQPEGIIHCRNPSINFRAHKFYETHLHITRYKIGWWRGDQAISAFQFDIRLPMLWEKLQKRKSLFQVLAFQI